MEERVRGQLPLSTPDRERVIRGLCGTAIALAVPLGAAHGLELLARLEVGTALPLLFGLVLGALAQDVVTGSVHWACDTWGDARTRWLGPGLIYWFREHHRDARGICDHDWIDVNREPGVLACLALVLLWLPPVQRVLDGQVLAYAGILAFIAYAGVANQIHQWAHRERVPRLVRAAQRARLILDPAAHARHHRALHLTAYCISPGWLNPLLDRIGYWRALERIVTRLCGARPRHAGGDGTASMLAHEQKRSGA